MSDLSNIEELIDNEVELTPEQQIEIYGYAALENTPPEMDPWTLGFHPSHGSKYGRYVLVEVRPAYIEMHHQVQVIDEDGIPVRGLSVIFGFDTGPHINLKADKIAWENHPEDLRGNHQRTDAMGYAQHTFYEGGENIFLGAIEDGVLRPSPMVTSCSWIGPGKSPIAPFIHTGVILTFQRRKAGVIPRRMYLNRLEARIETLKSAQAKLAQLDQMKADIDGLVEKAERTETDVSSIREEISFIRKMVESLIE